MVYWVVLNVSSKYKLRVNFIVNGPFVLTQQTASIYFEILHDTCNHALWLKFIWIPRCAFEESFDFLLLSSKVINYTWKLMMILIKIWLIGGGMFVCAF